MSKRCCKKLDESVIKSGFLNSLDFILTDCDGVLWIEDDAIPGSPETLQTLHKMGKKIVYVTNNSMKSRDDYVVKLKKLGYPVELENIVSTSYCIAWYFQNVNFTRKVYIIGSIGICKELDKVGIKYLPIGPDPLTKSFLDHINELSLDPEVGAVTIGFDEHFNFLKLLKASSYLKDKNCIFLVSNIDEKCATPQGSKLIVPGTGAFVSAVQIASGREPIILGKPTQFMFECISKMFPQMNPARSIMIGDRLNSDIELGTRHGIHTLLVLSGVNTLEDVKIFENSSDEKDQYSIPDFYLPCLGDLGKLIKNTS